MRDIMPRLMVTLFGFSLHAVCWGITDSTSINHFSSEYEHLFNRII